MGNVVGNGRPGHAYWLMAVSPNNQDRLNVLRQQHFCLALDLTAQVFHALPIGPVWNFLDRLPKPSGRREKLLRQFV